ncbi:RES family NAD+ phosphorylase [Puniceicoccales bacterium CK1056]|uniref:RES family NAD+ phosphorylase n=1 Tax=Oceanipulchritudo coccoides TaxID=2706888 RepID=A0A6B2LYE7_9BACT|nr:RES family NAD+ phosphorylase [Oceanipulchritudo coccoides]NDV61116.1 RES family NAD+ phosphorylase [Oceanipulchritudo coccoides]
MSVTIQDHPRHREILKNLRAVAKGIQITWSGSCYRSVELKWAHPDNLISGRGSLDHGSRWMRPGRYRVVYGASSAQIALKESLRAFQYYGVKKPRQNPRLLVQIDTSFSRIADLTSIEDHLSWPGKDDLLNEDWSKINERGYETLSQALGRALVECGFEGLVCNSSQDRRGRNIVWFPDYLDSSSQVEIVGSSELKKWLVRKHA